MGLGNSYKKPMLEENLLTIPFFVATGENSVKYYICNSAVRKLLIFYLFER